MNKINGMILDKTNWIEVSWLNDSNELFHCESFGDSYEYIELLNQRCLEFNTVLSDDNLAVLAEQKANRYVPTEEEIAQQIADEAKRVLLEQIAEAQSYLNSTDWIKDYKLRHDLGLELIPENSSKWGIISKRDEYIAYLRGDS